MSRTFDPVQVERRPVKCHNCETPAEVEIITVPVIPKGVGFDFLAHRCAWVRSPRWWFVSGDTRAFVEGERAGLVFRCPGCCRKLRERARYQAKKGTR